MERQEVNCPNSSNTFTLAAINYDNQNLQLKNDKTFIDVEFKARNKVLFIIRGLLIWSVIICLMAYDLQFQLFKWPHFNPNGLHTILFLLFSTIGLYWWIKVFDRRPQLSITKQGIWLRKSPIPFIPSILVNWEDIYFYYILENNRRFTSQYLIIRRKENGKDFKVELTGLDKTLEEILTHMRVYANKYQFQELGKEYS